VLPETAHIYGIAAGEITYATMLDRVLRRQVALAAAGFGTGTRVGLLLDNRPDFIELFLAANSLGASIVPINPDLRQAELEYLIAHSGMSAAFVVPGRHADVARAALAVGSAMVPVTPTRPSVHCCHWRNCRPIPIPRASGGMSIPLARPDNPRAAFAQQLLPAFGRLVSGHWRPHRAAPRRRADAYTAAHVPHERLGRLADGDDHAGRLPHGARPLPSLDLVDRCGAAAPPACTTWA
jgi:hypothetical protein